MKIKITWLILTLGLIISACSTAPEEIVDDTPEEMDDPLTNVGSRVYTYAGSGFSGDVVDASDTSKAEFRLPYSIIGIYNSTTSNDDLYVGDNINKKIKFIGLNNGTLGVTDLNPTFDSQQIGDITGITKDNNNNLYLTDIVNDSVIKITLSNNSATTIAGGSSEGDNNANGTTAKFRNPFDIVFDETNNCLYVADSGNNTIRKIDLADSNRVTRFAGVSDLSGGYDNRTNPLLSKFRSPKGLALLGEDLIVSDTSNNVIRKIEINNGVAGAVTTIAGQDDSVAKGDANYNDDNSTGLVNARFNLPTDIVVSPSNHLYIADKENNRIRKITVNGDNFTEVTTAAGSGILSTSDPNYSLDTTVTITETERIYDILTESFFRPTGLAFVNNNLYVADSEYYLIRKIEFYDDTP